MLEKLIVMLTHNDVTVPDAAKVFEENMDIPKLMEILGVEE